MKRTFIAAIALLSLAGVARADAFDVNSMPMPGFTAKTDNAATGSVAAKKVYSRKVTRGGAELIQYYTLSKDGSAKVFSEEAN